MAWAIGGVALLTGISGLVVLARMHDTEEMA
jgi:hypothetical protein